MNSKSTRPRRAVKIKATRRTSRHPGRFGQGLLPAHGFGDFFRPEDADLDWWAAELDRQERESATDTHTAADAPEPDVCPCEAETGERCRCGDEVRDTAPDAGWRDPRRDDVRSLSDAFEPPMAPISGGAGAALDLDDLWIGASLDAILADRERGVEEPDAEEWERLELESREYPPSGGID